ncbi:uncharacterized protein LOC135346271 isoform X2 [Halichondria panicea]
MEEEDQLKITQKQNGSDKELPIKTSSGSSTPIVGENRVHAVATNGSPAPNRAYTNQNGTQNTGMESPIIPKPKSSGSGAIAQHLKHILNKKSSEKETMKTSPKESSSTESGESTPVSKSAPNTDDFVVVEGRSSIRSNVSSISETSTGTDIESSIDTSTPLVSPTSSLSTNKMVKNPLAQLRLNNDEDVIQCRGYTMRSRTHTLAALRYKGKKPIERGRQRLTDIKKEEKKGQPKIKRQSSLTNLNTIGVDYELISPEIACWIRGKIIRDLENKYGGSEKANKAASKIQRMYREYKLQSRFKEIRREKHRRNRAHSMRTPGRRPSILNKKRPKYRRETSTPSVTDPLLKAREASKLLSKERTGHTHSGTRLELVQEKRQKVVELVEVTLEEELEATPLDLSQVVVNIEGACEDESSTDPRLDKTDGITGAFSTGDISRPLSIFSTGSRSSTPVSVNIEDGRDRRASEATPPVCNVQKFQARKFSIDTIKQKKNIGVNHFNRKPTKGIQYLVMSDILEDDPRYVAEFLMSHYGLSKEKIGEFLGEINSDFNMAVLECLVEQMDMRDKPIDDALRQFQQIFRMPGEAQKIDKIMEVFALEYYKANKDAQIRSDDAAYMLSFAIMMLHTSLHNPSVRSRITKKQWITMNRGCNESENFPETMLTDVYERILTHEFTTGADHTDKVIKIEKQITGSTTVKLANPQRHFLGKFSVNEVTDPNSKSFRSHRRTLFTFSDLLIVCKRNRSEYAFKESFFLLNLMPISFETHYYKYGVQIHSSMEEKIVMQFNCDSSQDRENLLSILEDAIAELNVMETERIAELGTTLAAKSGQDKITHGGSVKVSHRVSRGPGDLVDSYNDSNEQSGYVPGVGDIAVNSETYHHNCFRETHPAVKKENRTSGDSGFDSQQPTPSPSPTEPIRYTPSESPSPTHTTYLTPNPSATSSPTHVTPSHTIYLTPDSSTSHTLPSSPAHLTPGNTGPPRSKSSDALRTLTIIPSPAHSRSPSAELFRDTKQNASSSKKVKKSGAKRESSKKKSGVGLFGFGRSKTPSSPARRRGSSPKERRGSLTSKTSDSLDLPKEGIVETRTRSSSSVDLTKVT